MTRLHPTLRRGFTLVELMVAAALAILIMTVLAGAFSAGLESLSHLKAMGGLAERLRTTNTLLTEDLQAVHFDGSGSGSGPNLSDLRYDRLTPGGGQMTPPRGGFFFLHQGNNLTGGSIFEGRDQDLLFSTRGGHVLGFTVRKTATTARPDQQLARPDQLFTADLTPLITLAQGGNAQAVAAVLALNQQSACDACGGASQVVNGVPVGPTFASEWAEVFWFLAPSNSPQVDPTGLPQFTLRRRVRLITKTEIDIPVNPDTGLQHVFSCRQVNIGPGNDVWRTNTTASVRVPTNRLHPGATNPVLPALPIPVGAAGQGDDILLTNVLSFEVKPLWQQAPQWVIPPPNPGPPPTTYAAPPAPRVGVPATPIDGYIAHPVFPVPPAAIANADFPFDDLPVRNTILADPHLPENVNIVANVPNPTPYTDQRVFDTWVDVPGWNTPGNPNCIPFRGRVMAVQVKVRVYDINKKMTRQVTLVAKL